MLGGILGGGGGGIGGILGGMLGGPLGAMLGDMLNKVMSQVLQGVIEEVAKELKLPDSTKDLAQAQVAGALGDKEGVQKNLKELLNDFQKESGASDSDMGKVDREVNNLQDLFKKLFNEANKEEADRNTGNSKKKPGGSAGAAGGADAAGAAGGAGSAGGANAGGGVEGANKADGGYEPSDSTEAVDWFTKIAFALAKGAQTQADKVAKRSDELTNAMKGAEGVGEDDKKGQKAADNKQMEAQTKLQAESSKLNFLMTAVNASINALGEAMKTAAQVK
jgi:hypothetical protein